MNRAMIRGSLLLSGLMLLAFALLPAPTLAQAGHPLIGEPAPRLSGRALFGKGLLNLNKLQNQIVYRRDAQGRPIREGRKLNISVEKRALVLNFFATYCIPCIQEIPAYNRVAREYAERPVKFIYVNVDTEKTAAEVRKFAVAKGIEVEMMLPSVRYALNAYQIDGLPRNVVIDRQGIVTHVILGFQEDLARQIGDILAEVLPED